MGFIPKDAKWYLAEVVMLITVEGDRRNVVHLNSFLVRADSAQEAFKKSLRLGKGEETSFENSQDRRVLIRFKSLHDLNVIYDKLKDGAELTFSEMIGMTDKKIKRLVRPKSELAVFAPISRSRGPDYGSKEIREKVYERFPHLRPAGGTSPKAVKGR